MKYDCSELLIEARSRCVRAWANRDSGCDCESHRPHRDRSHERVCAQREMGIAEKNDGHDGARTR
jgi:hypothetical protein